MPAVRACVGSAPRPRLRESLARNPASCALRGKPSTNAPAEHAPFPRAARPRGRRAGRAVCVLAGRHDRPRPAHAPQAGIPHRREQPGALDSGTRTASGARSRPRATGARWRGRTARSRMRARRGLFAGGGTPTLPVGRRLVRRIRGQRSKSVRSSFQWMTALRFRLTEPKRRGVSVAHERCPADRAVVADRGDRHREDPRADIDDAVPRAEPAARPEGAAPAGSIAGRRAGLPDRRKREAMTVGREEGARPAAVRSGRQDG